MCVFMTVSDILVDGGGGVVGGGAVRFSPLIRVWAGLSACAVKTFMPALSEISLCMPPQIPANTRGGSCQRFPLQIPLRPSQ